MLWSVDTPSSIKHTCLSIDTVHMSELLRPPAHIQKTGRLWLSTLAELMEAGFCEGPESRFHFKISPLQIDKQLRIIIHNDKVFIVLI